MFTMLQKWFHNKRIFTERTVTPLTGRVLSILQKNSTDFKIYTAKPMDKYVYHIKGETKDWVVNLTDKTCTCCRFNLDLISYSYACAAIRYVYIWLLYLRNLYHIIIIKITYSICLLVFRSANRRSERYVSPYYKKETFVATYSGLLYPVFHPDEWDIPESVRSIVVNPPIWRKQAGRPRTTRISSAGERERRHHQVFSNCRQVGHNRVNCTNIYDSPETRASTFVPEQSSEPRHRWPRVCSVFG